MSFYFNRNSDEGSVDPQDVQRFSDISDQWWLPGGKFAPLHRLNPVRLEFIRNQSLDHFNLWHKNQDRFPFSGLTLLDIGCGGGLLSEPMARLGFSVTGIDASLENLRTASFHAREMGLAIDYDCKTVEDLVKNKQNGFDVILNMEVVEHVNRPRVFLQNAISLLNPGGIMFIATINRNLKSLAYAKIAAEYILRWLPAGTHNWLKFLTPGELRQAMSDPSLKISGPFGVSYNLFKDSWSLSEDSRINYMMTVSKPKL